VGSHQCHRVEVWGTENVLRRRAILPVVCRCRAQKCSVIIRGEFSVVFERVIGCAKFGDGVPAHNIRFRASFGSSSKPLVRKEMCYIKYAY
jgi:hypothetical protein